MVAQPSDSSLGPSMPHLIAEVIQAMQALPPDQQRQVLDFAAFLAQKNLSQSPQKTIWEKIDEAMAEVPDEEWEKVPTDGSYQHDHYLYGTPKREL